MQYAWEIARKKAGELLRVHTIGSDGLDDLISLAASFDTEVIVVPLDRGTSGFIIKEANKYPRIYVNAIESIERQRFTLAHEIGHLIDRREIAGDNEYSFIDYRGRDYDLHEFFADEFAGALLMPEDKIKYLQTNGYSKYETAKFLGVSIAALEKRLARLDKNPSHREI